MKSFSHGVVPLGISSLSSQGPSGAEESPPTMAWLQAAVNHARGANPWLLRMANLVDGGALATVYRRQDSQ